MLQISHPNIVKLYDIFDSRRKMCLVLDLLEGGELFAEMCTALAYLHERSIAHRDLKPENLLFSTKANDSAIKLIDFGLAGSCENGELKVLGYMRTIAKAYLGGTAYFSDSQRQATKDAGNYIIRKFICDFASDSN